MANNSQWLKIQNNIFSLHPSTIIPIFFLLIIIYKFLLITPKSKKNLPPCPTKLPIIGNFHQIDKRLPHKSLHNLSKKHGKIMLLQFGIKKVLIISSSEGAYEIMKTHDLIFANRPDLIMFKKLIYDCKDIATAPYGDYWRRMRSICVNQLLNNSRVQAFHNVREEEISDMNKQIKNREIVNLSNLLSNFATDVICRAAFGMKFNGEIDGINFKDLHEKHEELVGSFNVGDFIPWLGWINYVNGVEKEVKRVKRDMNRILEGLIEEHLDGIRKNEGVIKGDYDNDSNYENTRDFVHVLLDLQKDNSDYDAENCLTRESIKAIILDMFVAGSTTTFATLEWAMSELLKNPRAMKTLQKEVRSITGDKEIITETDLNKMQYLKAVIKETFRLHPAVPLLLPRVSTKETTINGYDIPAGTQVIINAWSIHRDPSMWNEPNEFNPERFTNSGIDFKGQHFNLIPFGAGRRGCPGILFGIANIELVIANLMQKFDWALPDGKSLDMVEYPGLTTHRNTPLILIATPYST